MTRRQPRDLAFWNLGGIATTSHLVLHATTAFLLHLLTFEGFGGFGSFFDFFLDAAFWIWSRSSISPTISLYLARFFGESVLSRTLNSWSNTTKSVWLPSTAKSRTDTFWASFAFGSDFASRRTRPTLISPRCAAWCSGVRSYFVIEFARSSSCSRSALIESSSTFAPPHCDTLT